MADIPKPLYSQLWASGGAVVAPSDVKIQTGWTAEVPPFQWENWSQHRQDQAIAHVIQHGIPVWDNITEYQYNVSGVKSLAMGSDGTIYRTKQTNVNQDPTTDVSDTYWEIAFANVSDFYNKTSSDARYLQTANNLSDLSSPSTARTNLSVYSQAQTYTQTQVDAKTTIASAAQAQAQAVDNTLITPLKLASAFQGANQSLASNGYQKLPGGVNIQMFKGPSISAGGSAVVNYPTPFTTLVFLVLVSYNGATSSAGTTSFTTAVPGLSSVTVYNNSTGAGTPSLFAIGY